MSKTLLVTGATGKVGRTFTRALFADPRLSNFRVRALCHNRTLDLPGRVSRLPTVDVKTPYHSTWLDNSKARFLLGWRAAYDMKKMTDAAFDYERASDDPRKTWYPG